MGRLVAAATSCGGEDPGAVGARVAALGGKILFALKHLFKVQRTCSRGIPLQCEIVCEAQEALWIERRC